MSSFAGSNARANAGSESVTKFIHNIWIGINISNAPAFCIPAIFAITPENRVAKNSTTISPTLLESKNWITFKILS